MKSIISIILAMTVIALCFAGCKTNKLANNLESEGRRGYIGKNTVDG